ncbi:MULTISPECIES: ATP synthase subunit K [Deinococcus]|jgi:ATP synthase subunit C.|uniref:V-type ATP synthase, K subunit n=1 Tax=Deinococcus radiodurans (strain ATCC 13939 / DSM 20539 / JCM 16871 / CCUG 27074 / LMG 4051 / NBRC 15346 / NCIMB 9279 / VKM B-1422 / R1) TaxID=243230 RepID=Q9RWH2_DEIRA|nr:ATP synthase subunit K [Deinococcus radiodurans]AAF10274.1 v-type ATP synthase, K subunit [Deinococcus radiodurans R1 = ATCC 13939 = DSM 20539]ANC72078.1 V-type ATP synthase subunit K [Deinococcus radiodurans R1 = ATCC 13939 = DSM 20539]QEM72636.1 V-type ATP synthase subunit K [Deinococcus radiodurans]QIP28851.1 V-type ATP synthase subunit K [Deinococcus radiodurans]QIP32443.1 V-type ATP synthase subunit K [Deinococcus radiodurans]
MTKTTKIALAALVLALATTGFAQETVTTAGNATNNAGLAAIGKGLALGLGALGTGVAQARIGSSLVGAAAEDPSKLGQLLLVFLLPETLVIFGFLALFLIR